MTNLKADTDPSLADSFSETSMRFTRFTHLWTIDSFSLHAKDRKIKSPAFSASPDAIVLWHLLLDPNGGGNDKGFIDVSLKMVPWAAFDVQVRFGISILNSRYEAKAIQWAAETSPYNLKCNEFGLQRLLPRREALSSTHFPGDRLIVRCEVLYTFDGQGPIGSTFYFPPGMPEYSPSANLRELLENGMFSDVVFNVNGRAFRAHKAILSTRSPTFKTLFERNSARAQPTRFEIRDVDDRTFSELLYLIYTGRTNESYPRIQNLLRAIAAQDQPTYEVGSSDEEEIEDLSVRHEDKSRKINESLSSKLENTTLADISTATDVSVLRSIKALIASVDSSALKPSDALTAIGMLVRGTSSALPRDDTSTSGFSEETPENKTTEIADKALPKNEGPILPPSSNADLQSDRLQDLSNAKGGKDTSVVQMKKFNGDENTFFEWWRGFEARVHNRKDLSICQKLSDLESVLEGEAGECINHSISAEVTYLVTLDSLFLRYGKLEALPRGMFAFLIAYGPSRSTLPLCIVDNRLLMERIEDIHRKNSAPQSASSCRCRSSEVAESEREEDDCCCAVWEEQHLNNLRRSVATFENLYEIMRTIDSDARDQLATEISISDDESIKLWLKLRSIDWRTALSPHWQLFNVEALRDHGDLMLAYDNDIDTSDFEGC